MPIVRGCIDCDADVRPPHTRCTACENASRRARRNPGYDAPAYRRHRDGVRSRICQRCKMTNAETVHHIDGDPRNNVPSNWVDACAPCARELDKEMRATRRRPFKR